MTADIRFYGFTVKETEGLLLMAGPVTDRSKVICCLEKLGIVIEEVEPDVKDKLMKRFECDDDNEDVTVEDTGADEEAPGFGELPLENVDDCAVQK